MSDSTEQFALDKICAKYLNIMNCGHQNVSLTLMSLFATNRWHIYLLQICMQIWFLIGEHSTIEKTSNHYYIEYVLLKEAQQPLICLNSDLKFRTRV